MNKIPKIKELNIFLEDSRRKAINYMRVRFSHLSDDDLQDIYQDASIALYQNIVEGRLEELSTSLFSYFMTICFNRTNVAMRHRFDTKPLVENTYRDSMDDEIPVSDAKMSELESLIEDSDPLFSKHMQIEHQEQVIRDCVKNMKEPCNKILWSMYWDNFSHTMIADMFGFKNANVSKTTASRCKDKFSKFLKENKILRW